MSQKAIAAERTVELIEELREHELSTLLHDVARIADGVGCLTDLAVRLTRDTLATSPGANAYVGGMRIAELRDNVKTARGAGVSAIIVELDVLEALLRVVTAREARS